LVIYFEENLVSDTGLFELKENPFELMLDTSLYKNSASLNDLVDEKQSHHLLFSEYA
jgi:hypothetical protein